jgi:mercuric ion transport protein
MKINPVKTGIIGSIVLALCCFTPILVVLLAAVGLSAAAGYLDYVLLPALGFFIILTVYALMRKKSSCCANTCKVEKTNEN